MLATQSRKMLLLRFSKEKPSSAAHPRAGELACSPVPSDFSCFPKTLLPQAQAPRPPREPSSPMWLSSALRDPSSGPTRSGGGGWSREG